MSTASTSAALAHLASRVASDPGFLAHALARYPRERGLTDEQLAADLGCDLDARSRGCGRVDCRLIAEEFGVKVEVIEQACWPW
jgi:hypothetical protein